MAKRFLHIIFLISMVSFSNGQKSVEKAISRTMEKLPQFPGDERLLVEYLAENLNYPPEAIEKRIQGRVYAEFIVEADGTISNVKIIRGIGFGCDKETIREIKEMPTWSPAERKGKKIRIKYSLPVSFYLPREKRRKK